MQLTEEQHLIQDMAKSLAQEHIKPFAGEWDQHLSQRCLGSNGRAGFLGMLIPEEWGGSGTRHTGLCVGFRRSRCGRWCNICDYERAQLGAVVCRFSSSARNSKSSNF